MPTNTNQTRQKNKKRTHRTSRSGIGIGLHCVSLSKFQVMKIIHLRFGYVDGAVSTYSVWSLQSHSHSQINRREVFFFFPILSSSPIDSLEMEYELLTKKRSSKSPTIRTEQRTYERTRKKEEREEEKKCSAVYKASEYFKVSQFAKICALT